MTESHDVKLARIEEKLNAIISKLDDNKKWQNKHEVDDVKQFDLLHDRISGVKRYAVALGVVACVAGFFMRDFLKGGI